MDQSQCRREKNRLATEHSNEINNPCAKVKETCLMFNSIYLTLFIFKEYKMATKCSLQYADDKDQCKAYFANYRCCMEFWVLILIDTISKSI